MAKTKIILDRQSDLVLSSPIITSPSGIVKADIPGLVQDLSGLTANLSSEVSRAEGAEASIAAVLSTEVSSIIANTDLTSIDSFAEVVANVSAEKSRTEAAELVLTNNLSAEVSDRIADVDAEESRAQSAELALIQDLFVETSRATSAELVLTNNLSAEISNRIVDVDAEESRAISAELVLTNNLASEVSNRISGDVSLTSNLSVEVVRAQSSELVLRNDLSSEVYDREVAIDAEASFRVEGDQSLQNQIDFITSNIDPVSIDSLTEIVAAFQSADGNLNGAITGLTATATSNLSAEVSRATSAELSLETAKLDLSGGTMSGSVNMGFNNIDNIFTITLDYIGGNSTDYVQFNGAGLNFNDQHKAINLPAPTNDGDAANKLYVDSADASIDSKLMAITDDTSIIFDANDEIALKPIVDALPEGAPRTFLGSIQMGHSGNVATGLNSHAEGGSTQAVGGNSHAEGENTQAGGYASHAEGDSTIAGGVGSHAEGTSTKTGLFDPSTGLYVSGGDYAHAEGGSTQAIGYYSHAEGDNTKAGGNGSHAEGFNTKTGLYDPETGLYVSGGEYAHAEGGYTQAIGYASHAEGEGAQAGGYASHAEGTSTKTGLFDPSTGLYVSGGDYAHAEGIGTQAIGNYSHAEGGATQAIGDYSHAEGGSTQAGGGNSHAEGVSTKTGLYDPETGLYVGGGEYAHAEGNSTQAGGVGSHAEGDTTQAVGNYSHAEGSDTQAIGHTSHAEGKGVQAIGQYAHAEGEGAQAGGYASHAEGASTKTGLFDPETGLYVSGGDYAHAEGSGTQAIGGYSHAEGYGTQAGGYGSHAEGDSTKAIGYYSHAEGNGTIAFADNQHAQGTFNTDNNATDLFVIGNGTDAENRSDLARFAPSLVTFNVDSKLGAQPETYASFDALSLVTKGWVDVTLSGEVSTEVSYRVAADLSLQNQIDFITNNVDAAAIDSLTEIVAAFQSADNDLNGAITGLTATATSNLSAEISNRIADVDAEESRAMSAELVLTNDLSSEISNRLADVNAEESRALSAELVLTNDLSSEISNRISGEVSLANDFTNIYAKKVVVNETPNGVITSFTFASPVRTASEAVYFNGLLQTVVEDYTLITNNGMVTGVTFPEAIGSTAKLNVYGVY